MMISPVCVPPVGKLHQQHELDEQENEPADGAYIAPHCEVDGGKKTRSHTTDGTLVQRNSVLLI